MGSRPTLWWLHLAIVLAARLTPTTGVPVTDKLHSTHSIHSTTDSRTAGFPDAEKEASYWQNLARAELNKALDARDPPGSAKNVILFLGDGMGVSTVTAARVLQGQKEGRPGEEGRLSFDAFPFTGLSKTYR